MAIKFVSSLDSGNVASLLEVFAVVMGLLVAANLQAIVSLAARRRLYSRGTARLSDSTWNVGVLQGVTNPRRLLRDYRACLAFFLAIVVISLEVLTVLQTKASKSCVFGKSSTWRIQKSAQKCFSPSALIESSSGSYLASRYISSAKEKAQDVDLDVGIPVYTDVYEDSIISGNAVMQLREGNFTEQYTAPALDAFDIVGSVGTLNGKPFLELVDPSGKDIYKSSNCSSAQGRIEEIDWIVRDPEFRDFEKNRSGLLTASTGYVEFQPCLSKLAVRVCEYVGGRQELTVEAVGEQQVLEVQCKIHVISREGRRTDAHSMASVLYDTETIDASSIRRAVLVSIIAQNSASSISCRRYIAAPKTCTQIGWVSMGAVLLLIGLLLLTSFTRLVLKIASRDGANFNGSPQMLAVTLFNHLEGPERRENCVPEKRKRRYFFLGPPASRLHEEDIHVSVMKGINDPDSYRLVWTRGPLPEGAIPAEHIPGRDIVSRAEKEQDSEEVSLV